MSNTPSFSIPGQQLIQMMTKDINSTTNTTTTTTTSTSVPTPLRDRRSNRRRVSCGFHHKRHQACPENCEGRVSHPPEAHPPVQDKFTVGCSECKSYFQNKLFILASSTTATTPSSSTSSNSAINSSSPASSPTHINKKRIVTSPSSSSTVTAPASAVEIIDNMRTSPIILNHLTLINNALNSVTNNNNEFDNSSSTSSQASSPSSSRPMSPIGEVPSIKSYESSPTFTTASISLSSSTSSPISSSNNIIVKPINLVSKIHQNNTLISFPVKFDSEPPEPQNQPLPQRRVSGSILGSSLKRKSNNQSLEFIGNDDSTFVPDDSPTSTPRTSFSGASSFSHASSSSTVVTPTSLSAPSSASYATTTSTAAANSAEAGLLHLLEAEVAKEIMTQKELELIERKKLQSEEKETVERIQQVLDYQKIQQQMEFHRLKKQNEELEQWRSKLELIEKDLMVKEEILKRRAESMTSSSSSQSKLSINSNLLKHISSEMNLYNQSSSSSSSTTTNQSQSTQPKQMSFDLLLNQQIPTDI